jgi:ubiquinone/menaquinone biosynthesis C-methylase UbiE
MNNQKTLWERLAKENSKYYINSDKGRKITDEEFRKSGEVDYKRLILDDPMIDSRESILDIGCGTGRMTEFMAKDFKQVIGVDISGEMIKQGKERLKGINNIQLFETDGNTFPLLDNSIDIAFSYIVLQHIKTHEMVLNNFREVFRVLKQWGLFKVLVRADRPDNMEAWWNGVSYDEDTIGGLCVSTGFSLIKLEPVKSYAFWLWMEK